MIGIICIIDLNYIPYLKKYTELLDSRGEEYEVIYWKRSEDSNTTPFKTVVFDLPTDLKTKKIGKVRQFLAFRRFVRKEIRQKKYDKLIVLSTLMGILIFDLLLTAYKGKYLFDIRDYTYEWLKPFYAIESSVIRNAECVVISSEGFKMFLPKHTDYVLCHNFNRSDIDRSRKFEKKEDIPLELTFIGAVRHYELDKKIVDTFSMDNRFKLVYHGYGATYEKLAEYCKDKNVLLTGKYNNADKAKLLFSADIVNSYYESTKRVNQYAISNKYYDAAIFKKPLWVNSTLYMGELAAKKGIGIVCEMDSEKVYDAYKNINSENFEESCNKVIAEVLEDEERFIERVNSFLKR